MFTFNISSRQLFRLNRFEGHLLHLLNFPTTINSIKIHSLTFTATQLKLLIYGSTYIIQRRLQYEKDYYSKQNISWNKLFLNNLPLILQFT